MKNTFQFEYINIKKSYVSTLEKVLKSSEI